MKTFNSIEGMYSYVAQAQKKACVLTAEKIKEKLYDYTDTLWYQAHTPQDYERTREFIDSIDVKLVDMGDSMIANIGFDTNKINAEQTENGKWNRHMSVDGEDSSDMIPQWIEEGQNSPLYSFDGVHMTEATYNYCISNNIPIRGIVECLGELI